ncbi:hypothetical protein CEXT_216911 [Caerostris extrusa]|uniref:Uncharacterized protein n=1 Tax=Caerostris extrusa TaxID=172846 RepID=A0AAV4XU22_CAEEX|nr:hypothetical protein CEXT_216911 [Caerostris extrusa]
MLLPGKAVPSFITKNNYQLSTQEYTNWYVPSNTRNQRITIIYQPRSTPNKTYRAIPESKGSPSTINPGVYQIKRTEQHHKAKDHHHL